MKNGRKKVEYCPESEFRELILRSRKLQRKKGEGFSRAHKAEWRKK